jgi:predicted regulator of Ras-like GTPase activity (Roadblock/LC7/MglB family)
MANLTQVVRGLAERDGVEAVVVLSADGLPIEHAARGAFDAESLAALTATLVQYATRVGVGAGHGALRNAVLEYERAPSSRRPMPMSVHCCTICASIVRPSPRCCKRDS